MLPKPVVLRCTDVKKVRVLRPVALFNDLELAATPRAFRPRDVPAAKPAPEAGWLWAERGSRKMSAKEMLEWEKEGEFILRGVYSPYSIGLSLQATESSGSGQRRICGGFKSKWNRSWQS